MELIANPKNFFVIACTRSEMAKYLDSPGICDFCNGGGHNGHDMGYLVAVLSQWICPECYNRWYENAVRYDEDIPVEKEIAIQYCKAFKIDDVLSSIYWMSNGITKFVRDINDINAWYVYLKYNDEDRLVIAKHKGKIVVSKEQLHIDICTAFMVNIVDLTFHKGISGEVGNYYVQGNTVGVKCSRCEGRIFNWRTVGKEKHYRCTCGKTMIFPLD